MSDKLIPLFAAIHLTTALLFGFVAVATAVHRLSVAYRLSLALITAGVLGATFLMISSGSLEEWTVWRTAKDIGLMLLAVETARHWNYSNRRWKGPKPPRRHDGDKT